MPETVIRNEYGEVVYAERPAAPTLESAVPLVTPQQVADHYLRTMRAEVGLAGTQMADDRAGALETAAEAPVMEFASEKEIAGTTVVVYQQKAMGLEVFEAVLGMQIATDTLALDSMQSSMHATIDVENPGALSDAAHPRSLTRAALKKLLGIDLPGAGNIRIARQVIYRYEPDAREESHEHDGGCIGGPGSHIPHLPAPSLKGLAKGKHYIADEVLFEAALAPEGTPVNWRALIEPESGEVLYLRALVACATGLVFDRDPQTQSGTAATAASANAVLNPFRSNRTLAGLTPATPQPLSGTFVRVADVQLPTHAPPSTGSPAGAFNFDVRTDNFAAVNAYHNCDRMFRTMQDYGFNVSAYFDGTSFPVDVDHRALSDAVNAQAPGNATGTGLGRLLFGRVMSGQPVGMATSNRVAWHEFGHALLWDHVSSPNFGFAHSAGDALAAILNDPGSQAGDRFQTFPWVQAGTPGINRRHDRAVTAGWGWFGANWNTQYGGEQVLSTTLFRLYRALGGDSANIATQRRAAETTAFLIFKAIGLMTSTTQFPTVYEALMETADKTTADFKGIPGGALHKVIRWAFEKQGLFQAAAVPGAGNTVNREGDPPAVDVYIDDGRGGEYQYQANHWSCQDIWVRRAADGGLSHQNPVVNFTNYMYVRVKNRGLQAATNVRVDAYHALPGSGLAFPDDWAPMATATLPLGGSIAPGGSAVIGPFAFVPTVVGHECLLAIAHATGDAGNDTTIQGTIPEHRFVPFDNNIGQRNVSPVLPTLGDILRLLREHIVWIRNPFRRVVKVNLEVVLPRFLRELGWQMHLKSEGGQRFELGPRDRRKVMLVMEPGKELDPALVKRALAQGDSEIALNTYIDGELVGGMSYRLGYDAGDDDKPQEPKPDEPAPDRPVIGRRPTIEEILRILRSGGPVLGDRTVRTVRLEFDLDDDA